MRKKCFSLLLAVAMTLSMLGCTQSSVPDDTTAPAQTEGQTEAAAMPQESESVPEASAYTAGEYEREVNGRNGKMTVKVTLSEEAITGVEVVSHSETANVAGPALERIPAAVVENQTVKVDTVTGATITSAAILSAVRSAVEEAGGDVSAMPEAYAQAKEPVELEADVVVVGGGGAGMSAAVSALDEGASVILLEKTAALGGNTVLCGGAMNAVNSQWAAGFEAQAGEAETLKSIAEIDEALIAEEYLDDFHTLQDQIAEYLDSGSGNLFDSIELHTIQTYYNGLRYDLDGNAVYGNYELVTTMTRQAPEAIEWLREKGVQWDDSKVTQPVGAMWRRGHNPSMPKGTEFVAVLQPIIEEGGQILFETAAESLVIENSRVTGVRAVQADGTPVTVKARNGVVLACGGFGNNLSMVQEYNNYWESIPDDTRTTNASGQTGDGIRMGLEAGAALTGMEFAQMMPVSDPVSGDLFTGLIPQTAANYIFFNSEGRRFVNECEARDTLTIAALENGGTFYMVADSVIAEECRWLTDWEVEVENGRALMADSLEELAGLMGYDEATTQVFLEEVEKYNACVDAGVDEEFGKSAFNNKIEAGPFYATPRKPAVHHTMGGLVIDTGAHVLTEAGQPIEGLYAAGEVTGGIHAGNRLGGNAVADIMVFGRIAGANAASGQ